MATLPSPPRNLARRHEVPASSSRAGASASLLPEVLPGDAGAGEVRAAARIQALAGGQLDGVQLVEGKSEGSRDARPGEAVVLLGAIERRAPALIIGRAERGPHAAPKLAREVRLQRIQRVLAADVAVEVLVVPCEERDAAGEL